MSTRLSEPPPSSLAVRRRLGIPLGRADPPFTFASVEASMSASIAMVFSCNPLRATMSIGSS